MKSFSFPALALALSLGVFAAGPAGAQMQMDHGSMQKQDAVQMDMAQEGIFEGEGKIVALVPAKNQVVLQHGEIKGFMGPMTMGYALASSSLAQGLKPGDSVKFRIDSAKKTIVAIERRPK